MLFHHLVEPHELRVGVLRAALVCENGAILALEHVLFKICRGCEGGSAASGALDGIHLLLVLLVVLSLIELVVEAGTVLLLGQRGGPLVAVRREATVHVLRVSVSCA